MTGEASGSPSSTQLGIMQSDSSLCQQDGPAGREPLAEPRGRVSPPKGGDTPTVPAPEAQDHEGTLGGPRVDLSPCVDCNGSVGTAQLLLISCGLGPHSASQ